MVIQQFNKLIRNKWVWGVFAVAVSAAFCFDDLFTTREREERSVGDAGTLAGESVSAKEFLAIAEEIRGFGQMRDWKRKSGEVNRNAWENYAALTVADKAGITATDADVQEAIRNDRTFQQNGAFSFALYQRVLREYGLNPERFEAYLKRMITLQRIGQSVLAAATWASPMEIDRAVADMTDKFTVKVATFNEDAKEAAAVKVGEKELKAWYEKNTKALALPERTKVRFVKFDATDKAVLAKMSVSTNDVQDRFDVTIDKYTTKDTNGVEIVRKFSDLTKAEKDGIENELRQIAAVQFFETNLNVRAYAKKAAKGSSRLDEIAKEDGRKVQVSDWFALDGAYLKGFMSRLFEIFPGANGAAEAIAELDPASEDLRYAVISSEKAVWLVEKAEVSKAHTPDFAEAKKPIEPMALKDARADAFKAKVEAVAKQGAKAVAAVKGCTTNITFSVSELRSGTGAKFDNEMSVARAAMKLKKGEVSEFTPVTPGRAILVVCEDRVPGDVASQALLRSQVVNELARLQLRQIPDSWKKWNLERLGFEPGEVSSVIDAEDEE